MGPPCSPNGKLKLVFITSLRIILVWLLSSQNFYHYLKKYYHYKSYNNNYSTIASSMFIVKSFVNFIKHIKHMKICIQHWTERTEHNAFNTRKYFYKTVQTFREKTLKMALVDKWTVIENIFRFSTEMLRQLKL